MMTDRYVLLLTAFAKADTILLGAIEILCIKIIICFNLILKNNAFVNFTRGL